MVVVVVVVLVLVLVLVPVAADVVTAVAPLLVCLRPMGHVNLAFFLVASTRGI